MRESERLLDVLDDELLVVEPSLDVDRGRLDLEDDEPGRPHEIPHHGHLLTAVLDPHHADTLSPSLGPELDAELLLERAVNAPPQLPQGHIPPPEYPRQFV